MKDLQTKMINSLVQGLITNFENLIIEGLRIKGFEFKNKSDLEKFVKSNCKVEDNPKLKERIYYVDDIPFFLHKYEIEIGETYFQDGETNLTASYGSYSYL